MPVYIDQTFDVGGHYLTVFVSRNVHFRERSRGGAHPQVVIAIGFTVRREESDYEWLGRTLGELVAEENGT